MNRKQNNKINENNKIYKKKKLKNLYISKDYYQIYDNEIILIQRKFIDYLKNKNNKNCKLNQFIKYIPKDICQITKLRLNSSNKNESLKEKTNAKNNNITIRKIKNNLAIIQSNFNKKHRYNGSKLFQSNINKILLNGSEIRYETNNYTYLKKCHFRKNSNSSEDEEDEINRRPFTCEIMRKIKFTPDKRHLTPDYKNNKINIKINLNLKIIKLDDTQYINDKQNKKKNKNKNKLKEIPYQKDNINNLNKNNNSNSINDLEKNNSIKHSNNKINLNYNENNNIKNDNLDNTKGIDNNENNYKISYIYYKKNSNDCINNNKEEKKKEIMIIKIIIILRLIKYLNIVTKIKIMKKIK